MDFIQLSYNKNIDDLDIIENNIDKSLSWFKLSINPNITLEFIQNNLNKDWDWYSLSINPDITLEFIKNNE